MGRDIRCWMCRRNADEIAKTTRMSEDLVDNMWSQVNPDKLDRALGIQRRDFRETGATKDMLARVKICIFCLTLIKGVTFGGMDNNEEN